MAIGLLVAAFAFGGLVTVPVLLYLIGPEARKVAFKKVDHKVLVVEWANAARQEVHIMMGNTPVFMGIISSISLTNNMSGSDSMNMQVTQKPMVRNDYAAFN